VQALAQFRSEANAAVLQRQLDDPASRVETKDGRAERVLYIREAAYQTLHG
jgi:hypothetical protein